MLVSPTVITNPNSLRISMTVNDVKVQDSNTSDMVFDVASIVSFLSQSTTLPPGTVILTGTPEGIYIYIDIRVGARQGLLLTYN